MRKRIHPAQIMIVDNDVELAESIQEELRPEFELVDFVLSCSDAIHRIEKSQSFYDVVIMDQNIETEADGSIVLGGLRK